MKVSGSHVTKLKSFSGTDEGSEMALRAREEDENEIEWRGD